MFALLNKNSSHKNARAISLLFIVGLIYLDICVYILATDKCVVEDVTNHGNDDPVRCDWVDVEGYLTLDERHDTTTNYHCHEET